MSICLATCHELGVSEVYRLGGAQGVAALAYGIEGLPRVDKIVGPGSLFVALAKKFVFGEVDIDSIAGPSEVVVIADESARADFTAADLIAQAEHAPGRASSSVGAIRCSPRRRRKSTGSWPIWNEANWRAQSLEQFGAFVRVRSADEAAALADEIAAEHLHIATAEPERLLEKIPHAGAVFLGHYSPVALGDYVAGPSHVLPTGGTARWASGLSANDFLRGNSVIAYTRAGLAQVADDIRLLAEKEGLTAHRDSVLKRVTRSMSFVRPEIAAMRGYVPGEQPRGGKFIKLNTNENPYPCSAAVNRAIQAALEHGLQRYPDPMAEAFRRRAGEVLGVEPSWILCGNGSDDILTIVTRAFVGEKDWLRLPYPSYILYRTLAQLQGAEAEETKFRADWSLGPEFAAPRAGLKLAFLPNPNSPSGTVLPPDRIRELADGLPCPLLVDEAYVDFAETNCVRLVAENEKIMVSRTLEQVVCVGRAAVRLCRRSAAGDRAVDQGEGFLQLRRLVDRRGDRRHRRPGLVEGKSS